MSFDPSTCLCRAKGAEAAERAKILQEYQLRKHQAAAYKARGRGNVFGVCTSIRVEGCYTHWYLSISKNSLLILCPYITVLIYRTRYS